MSLHTKYRPTMLKNYIGNDGIVESVKNVVARKNPPASFLITGPSGCGKTTLGRIIARALKCKKSCFEELDSSVDRGIDAIRKILSDLQYPPLNGPKKILLLDEAHGLTKPAQEALLKTLEKPPDYVHFIICTTNPEVFSTTFKRRCHNYEVALLTSSELIKLMRLILKKEQVKTTSDAVLDKIVELSDGAAGIALKYLDMVIDFTNEKKAISTLKAAGTTDNDVKAICQALLNTRISDSSRWLKVKSLLKQMTLDGEAARRPILGYMNKVMLNNGGGDVAMIMHEFVRDFYASGTSGLTLACYKACFISEE